MGHHCEEFEMRLRRAHPGSLSGRRCSILLNYKEIYDNQCRTKKIFPSFMHSII